MKLLSVVAAVALAGCIMPHEITATSYTHLPPSSSEIQIEGSLKQAQWIVVEKLANRGFPLVDRRDTATGVLLKFAGNRDFSGAFTLGSVFYAWLNATGPHTVRLQMIGKPTIDHREGCPSEDGTKCAPLQSYTLQWGVTGAEEATAIHGVFSELMVDGVVNPGAGSATSATATR